MNKTQLKIEAVLVLVSYLFQTRRAQEQLNLLTYCNYDGVGL